MFLVYIREAHPSDGWQMPSNVRAGIVYEQPKDIEARRVIAKNCLANLGLRFPTLLDGMDNAMEKAYRAWPNRVYILGGDGLVYWKGLSGPAGVRKAPFEPALAKLLALPGGGRLTDVAPRLATALGRPVTIDTLRLPEGLAPARAAMGILARSDRPIGAAFEIDAPQTLRTGHAILASLGLGTGLAKGERVREASLVAIDEAGKESERSKSKLFRLRYDHFWRNAPIDGDHLDLVFDAKGLREIRGVWHRPEAAEGAAPTTVTSLAAAKSARMTRATARAFFVPEIDGEGRVALRPVWRLTRGRKTKDVPMVE